MDNLIKEEIHREGLDYKIEKILRLVIKGLEIFNQQKVTKKIYRLKVRVIQVI